MRRSELAFILIISLIASAILAQSSLAIAKDQWPVLLSLSVGGFISMRLYLYDLSVGRLNFSAGAAMAAFIVAGPDLALWSLAISSLVAGLLFRRPFVHVVLNNALLAVTAHIAYSWFLFLGGQWGAAFNHPLQAFLMTVLYMVTNALLWAAYVQFHGTSSLLTAMRNMLNPGSAKSYLVVTGVGILFGFVYLNGGFEWAIAVLAFAYALHSTLRRYFDTVNEARSQTQQLAIVLNATKGALIMTDPDGAIKVANKQAGTLFDLDAAGLTGQPLCSVPQLQQIVDHLTDRDEPVEQVINLSHGEARHIHFYRAPIYSAQGALHGHIHVLTDVTALKEAEDGVRHMYDSIIRALTAAVDARDSYTHGHSARVSAYSVAIASQLGLSAVDLDRIRYSSLLHDIGKLGVDDRVLRKHGALTPSERALMMQHPVIGADVLQKANILTELIPGVRWHHEWVSGGGYPDGLKADQIPLDARIIGVADALDAMTTDRPYRSALPPEEAIHRIRVNTGVQFDQEVANALMAAIEAGELVIGDFTHIVNGLRSSDEGIIRPVHGKELAILYQLSQEDYAAMSLDAMLYRYLHTFHETVGPNLYLIYLVDGETGQLELQASYGVPDKDVGRTKDLRVVRDALDMGAPVVVNNVQSLSGYVAASESTKSEVVVPLIAQGEMLGALVVEAGIVGFFGRDDLYLLEALGQRMCSSVKLITYHQKLAFAMTHDSLTGVHNHGYFYERLTQEVQYAAQHGRPLSILIMDLKGLRAVNDNYGHLAGDEALREYARVLKLRARRGDLVARYGGDEFAIIMPDADRAAAKQMADWLAKELVQTFPYEGAALPLPSAVWGLATYPKDGTRSTELVFAADRALQREKRSRVVRSL